MRFAYYLPSTIVGCIKEKVLQKTFPDINTLDIAL